MADTTFPDSHKDILDAPGFAHLATLGPDGVRNRAPRGTSGRGTGLILRRCASPVGRELHRLLE